MSSKQFKKNLQNESREQALTKFYNFINEFNARQKLENQEKRIEELTSTINLNDVYSFSEERVENVDFLELIQTSGNMKLNSIIMVLFYLNKEMTSLAIDGNQLITTIAFYGNMQEDDTSLDEVSKLIDVLFDLVCYLQRCNHIGINYFKQLATIFDQRNDRTETMMIRFKNTRLDQILETFQKLTITIINIEEVIRTNSKLKKDFSSYKQVIQFMNLNEKKFNLDEVKKKEMTFLLSLISKIECDLFKSNSFFNNFYCSIFASMSVDSNLIDNQIIQNHFQSYIRYKLNEFEISKFIQLKQWLGLCSLFVIYIHIFKKEDKKLCRIVLETQKRLEILLINLEGNVFIIPDMFLMQNLPKSFVERRIIDLFDQQREQLLHQSKLIGRVKDIEKNLVNWFLRFTNLNMRKPSVEENIIDRFHNQVKILENGLILLKNCNIAKIYINLYLHLNKSISKSELIQICKLIIFTKAIQLAFLRKKSTILLIISKYSKFCSYKILKNFNQLQIKLKNDYQIKAIKKAELLSIINLASNCINGTFTEKRRFIMYFLISILVNAINEYDSTDIKIYFRRILFLDDLFKNLDELCNCDFLFFNNTIIETFFHYCSETDSNLSSEMIYFFYAINDCFNLIVESLYYDEKKSISLCQKYEIYLIELFKINFLDRICTQYENELRLQIHYDLQLENLNPFRRKLFNFLLLFNLGIIPLFNKFISVKNYLEYYLNKVSYTLTSIALHDWKTYESMLNLSRNREKLDFVSSQLPTQQLEQGLDFLELTRNIQSFTVDFNYNLNNQMFIQKFKEERYLNILQIKHVSNSIQTHGFGILNTAVNYIYKFLKNRFNIFSQFLFQEQVKSKLLKEIRDFKESEEVKYKFEDGRNFLQNLQKLGTMQNGRTYVNEFEQLITQIGNSLALIRLLRSGSFHCLANSLKFISDFEELNEQCFEKMAKNCNLNERVIEASKILDENLNLFKQNFCESKDYFNIIIRVFENSLKNVSNSHLKNFYIILPALMVSHVENMLINKEKLSKKNENGFFSDDGFALGIAYCLRLLDQINEFKSLRWFENVREEINEKVIYIEQKQKIDNNDEKLSQTSTLKIKKLKSLQIEFSILEYNLGSCLCLFRKFD